MYMRRHVLPFIIILAITPVFGCSIKVVDVKPEIPDMQMKEKLPLRAAVVIPEASLNLQNVTTVESDCMGGFTDFTSYPFGTLFRDAAQDIFSQMFSHVEVNSAASAGANYDVVLELHFDSLKHKIGCGFTSKSFFTAEGSLRILDRQFKEIWTSEWNSAQVGYDSGTKAFDPNQISVIVSERISRAIVSLVRGWGNELQQSYVLVKYARDLHSPQPAEATAPQVLSEPVPASVSSDVDEIPSRIARERRNAYAIVIGIEHYRQKLPAANFAVHDAQAITEYLTKVLGYPERNVVTLLNTNAAKSDFEKYFDKWLPNNVERDSTVFVYFSGHGAPDPANREAYLVPYDGDPAFIEQTGYPLKRLYDRLGKLPAKEVIVALDSCFSGAGGRSVLAPGMRPLVMNLQSASALSRNIVVLTASSGAQVSATYQEKGHGLFTYFLLKGIKNEDVANADGSIEVKDLFEYMKPQVERIARKYYNTEQSPQLIRPRR
jgi:hypothetical protein